MERLLHPAARRASIVDLMDRNGARQDARGIVGDQACGACEIGAAPVVVLFLVMGAVLRRLMTGRKL